MGLISLLYLDTPGNSEPHPSLTLHLGTFGPVKWPANISHISWEWFMRSKLFGLALVAVLVIGLAGAGLAQGSDKAAKGSAMSIEGTYVLNKRVMADSSVITGPDVGGMMTYTKDLRQLNVFWKNPDGSISSRSLVTKYKLTGNGYDETSLFLLDQNLMGEELKTLMTSESGTGEVTVKGKETEVKMPLFGEPTLTFTPDGLTANMAGQWIDYWEKVK